MARPTFALVERDDGSKDKTLTEADSLEELAEKLSEKSGWL